MLEGTRCTWPSVEAEIQIERMAATVVNEQPRTEIEAQQVYTLWRSVFIRLWSTRKPLTIPERNYLRTFMDEGLYPAGPILGFWGDTHEQRR